MYSILKQAKTSMVDRRGLSVYRRLYLCNVLDDVNELPTEDAPGSGALVANGGFFYLLDNNRLWCRADEAVGIGGCIWTD